MVLVHGCSEHTRKTLDLHSGIVCELDGCLGVRTGEADEEVIAANSVAVVSPSVAPVCCCAGCQYRGDQSQQLVSKHVIVRVVEGAQVVEITHDHGAGFPTRKITLQGSAKSSVYPEACESVASDVPCGIPAYCVHASGKAAFAGRHAFTIDRSPAGLDILKALSAHPSAGGGFLVRRRR